MKRLTSKIVIGLVVIIMAGAGFLVGSHFNNNSHAISATADGTSQISVTSTTAINTINNSSQTNLTTTGATSQSSTSITRASTSQDPIATIYNNASPAVVEIVVTLQGRGYFGGGSAQGSGFLIDNQGDILTNNHVIEGATSVQVILKDGTTISAKVLGTDSIDDLAVINVAASSVAGITPLQFGDSSTVRPGQTVIAIGSPYGLTDSVTTGIVSGLNRSVTGSNMMGMLQTDASINPGNSGGPLLDTNGLVIGINTLTENSANGGIGFAVPSAIVQHALPNLIGGAAN